MLMTNKSSKFHQVRHNMWIRVTLKTQWEKILKVPILKLLLLKLKELGQIG